MSSSSRRTRTRLNAPFMFVFRDAHRARDARLHAGQADEAGNLASAARHAAVNTISEPQLRAELMRDLELLMNTTNLESSFEEPFEAEIRRSILNFGMPDIIQVTIDENRVEDIARVMAEAVITYEPRLVKESVKVTRDTEADISALAVRFNVAAEIACDPITLPIDFIADLEVASGRLAIRKR